MVPCPMLGEQRSWMVVLSLLALAPGVVAAVLWSPCLLTARLRSLVRALPPRRFPLVAYLAVMVGGSAPYVVGFVVTLSSTADASGAVIANAILNVTVPLSVGYVVGIPMLAGLVLPRIGLDWDATGYGPGTWALLVIASAWYAALFAVPLFLMAFIVALPT